MRKQLIISSPSLDIPLHTHTPNLDHIVHHKASKKRHVITPFSLRVKIFCSLLQHLMSYSGKSNGLHKGCQNW